ncbi:MAG: nonribosomal peptide synthetase MxaA [Hyphomicrobium sp.]|jgi:mxaA protein
MRLVVALVVAMSVTDLASAASTPSVSVRDPRAFGYFLGDVIHRKVTVRVGPNQKLDTASLPRPGPLNYWLEIAHADHHETSEGDDTVHTLDIDYQTFYAPLDPRKLTIPGFNVKIEGAGELAVPEFGFIMSPIRQLFAAASQSSGSAVELQADKPARRLSTGAERTALLISGIAALIGSAGLAWHNAWWPFNRRPSRPFTEAARYLRANAASLAGAGGYRDALLRLHRAFDLAAGRRVLADDVPIFIGEHPEFQSQRPAIERLFLASRYAFFADDVADAQAEMPLDALVELSADLGAAERRAA